LNKQAQPFVAELWKLLLDAQDSPHGIPRAFVERKKAELVKRREAGGDERRGDDKRGDRRARSRSRSRSRERGRGGRDREAAQRSVVRAASNRGRSRSRSRSRERSRRGASSPERRQRKRSGFSSAPAAPAPAPAPAKEESPPAWNATRGPSSRSTPSNGRLTVDRSPQAAAGQARAAAALALEGVAEYAGRLLLH